MKELNPIVYMDLRIDEERVGRIIIELYANVVPKTVENFLALCVGDRGVGRTGRPLHYKGTIFHKVVSGVFIQGGDVTNLDGSSGESIFGEMFEDENYELKHDSPGILSTVNSGKSCNNSQFIITTTDCPHLDGSSVVFGKVIKGLSCVIQLSEVETKDDYPLSKCIIDDCGQLKLGDPWNYVDCDETNDNYPPDPKDLEVSLKDMKASEIINIISTIKESGNYFFKNQNYIEADRKYRKALRYVSLFTSQIIQSYIDFEINATEVLEQLDKERLSCLLNLSATTLKKGHFRESLKLCEEVLKKDPSNAKAHFRRGKALMCLNDYEGALSEQRTALTLAPNDSVVIKEISDIQRAIKNYLIQEKQVFSKMFHPFK